MNEKEKLIEYIENFDLSKNTSRNSMGCSELWYDSYFCVMQSFTLDEIKSFNELEIEHLLKVAETVSEGLY